MLDKPSTQDIIKTSAILQIPGDFVKKDFYVTDVIQKISDYENEHYYLSFQGGTSLSKAYGVLERMSEDVDFRVVEKDSSKTLGKNIKRKNLRMFRHGLVDLLRKHHYAVKDETIKVFYEGTYTQIQVGLAELENLTYLRPYLLIELFLNENLVPCENKKITTLVSKTLNQLDGNLVDVRCVSIKETIAEKLIALVRRVLNTEESQSLKLKESDLVRHLYDITKVFELYDHSIFENNIIRSVAKIDQSRFDTPHDFEYNISKYLGDTIQNLANNVEWQDSWHRFINSMVFAKEKPTYLDAINVLKEIKQQL